MRILHVLHTSLPHSCGYSIRSDRIISLQQQAGYDLAVVTSARQPDGAVDEIINGISYSRTPEPRLRRSPIREYQLVSSLAKRVRAVIEQFRPEVVHAHSPVLVGLPAYTEARRRKIPVVYEVRDLWENAVADHGRFAADSVSYRIARTLETRLLRRANAVVTLCDALREELSLRTSRPITVTYNGVDPERFVPVPAKEEWFARWNPKRRPLLVYLGSFQPYEGIEVLMRSMSAIVREVPEAELLVVGDGAIRSQLEALRLDLGLENAIRFVGRIPHEQVGEVYAVADLLVYPRIQTRTTNLTTPLKTLEALAMEKAVLASDLKPLRELVSDGVTGRLFSAGDADDLATKAVAMLTDAPTRNRYGSAGRAWVERERRWTDSVARYDAVYASVSG